jgi:hypothetical protein
MSFNFGATGINSDTAGGGGGDKAPAAQPPSFGDTGSFGSKDDSEPSFPESVCARGRGAPHLRRVEIKVPPPQKQKMPPRKGVPPNSPDDALSRTAFRSRRALGEPPIESSRSEKRAAVPNGGVSHRELHHWKEMPMVASEDMPEPPERASLSFSGTIEAPQQRRAERKAPSFSSLPPKRDISGAAPRAEKGVSHRKLRHRKETPMVASEDKPEKKAPPLSSLPQKPAAEGLRRKVAPPNSSERLFPIGCRMICSLEQRHVKLRASIPSNQVVPTSAWQCQTRTFPIGCRMICSLEQLPGPKRTWQ